MTIKSIVGLCLFMLASAAPAGDLGRLFHTPEQRAELDRERARNASGSDSPDVVSVDGVVQRKGGKRTVWINRIPQEAGHSDEHHPESVPITVPGSPRPLDVKVGQKVIVAPPPAQD